MMCDLIRPAAQRFNPLKGCQHPIWSEPNQPMNFPVWYFKDYQYVASAEHMGHCINPFSLQWGHLTTTFWSLTSLQLPLHSKQGTNLIPPHPSQTLPAPSVESPARSPSNLPSSWSYKSSPAPPIYLPLMNNLGTGTGFPINSFSSFLKSRCIETSLSSMLTPKLSSTDLTLLQSS